MFKICLFVSALSATVILGCKKSSSTTETPNNNVTQLPAVFGKFNSSVTISLEGNYVVLKSNGLPDHKSPYYQGTQWAAAQYEAYNGSNPNFMINPNRIAAQNLTYKIPVSPAAASTHESTPMGPMVFL